MKRLIVISVTLALAGCAPSQESTSTRFFELGGRVEQSPYPRDSIVIVAPDGTTTWIIRSHHRHHSRRHEDHGEKK